MEKPFEERNSARYAVDVRISRVSVERDHTVVKIRMHYFGHIINGVIFLFRKMQTYKLNTL